jgi:hypothetical protein
VKKMSKEDRMIELLEELVKWTKVTSIASVKKLLLEILPKPEQKIAYQASDGATVKEVAKQANASVGSVSKWWEQWTRSGIAEDVPVRGGKRTVRKFSLEDFGIEVPVITVANAKEGKGGEVKT